MYDDELYGFGWVCVCVWVLSTRPCLTNIKSYNKNVLITWIRFLFSLCCGSIGWAYQSACTQSTTIIIHSPRSTCAQINWMTWASRVISFFFFCACVCVIRCRWWILNTVWLYCTGCGANTRICLESEGGNKTATTPTTRTFNLRYLINRSDLSLGEIRRH